MEKYKFLKIKDNWYFNPNSVKQIEEHWDKYVCPYMEKGMRALIDRYNSPSEYERSTKGHWTNNWPMVIEFELYINGGTVYETADRLEKQIKESRINAFNKGIDIAFFSDGMSILFINPSFNIQEYKILDSLQYPIIGKMNEVRFIQWPNGKHWYCKIGNEDIVDKNGNQKWDDRSSAYNAAQWYLANKFEK